jgi:hypothetical protein
MVHCRSTDPNCGLLQKEDGMTQERFQEIADAAHRVEYAPYDSPFPEVTMFLELFDYCLVLRKQVFDLTKDPGIPYKGSEED